MKLFGLNLGKKSTFVAATPEKISEMIAGSLGGVSASGVSVSADVAMQQATVYACVRVLAESVASLPMQMYERLPDGSRRVANNHPLYRLVHAVPNGWQTAYELYELLMAHLALRGNAYCFIARSGTRVVELIPLHPDRVRPVPTDNIGELNYEYFDPRGRMKIATYSQQEILHIPGLSFDGLMGITPIAYQRHTIGDAIATEKHGSKLLKNGVRVGGVLTHPGQLSEEAARRLKESWDASHGGENAYGTALLEEGTGWQQLGMTNIDAQWLESRRFQKAEIAAIFRVPPHKVGDLSHATFSNIEHQGREFYSDSLLPWLKRLEQRLSKQLLTRSEQDRYYFEFKVDALLRADTKTRFETYQIALQNGIMSSNEVRALENLNPREGGDAYMTPLNMSTGQDAPETTENE